ncbi:MAG: UbiA family prenyltransferase [Candidatus Moraniibacteriota bacterium]|nr:MAG: UbiA family prenyltransferase [Candidatus Moranbacteria bacterium]
MKLIILKLERIISLLENTKISFSLWIGTFLSIIFSRILIENLLGGFSHREIHFLFSEFSHTFLFFLLSYCVFLVLLSKTTKTNISATANVLLWGFLIILIPPIIDYFISHGRGLWSFYEFDSLEGLLRGFFTFFGDTPNMGITYGVRIEVILSLFLFFVYVFIKTKDYLRALLTTFIAYTFFFILGTFPSWIAFFVLGWEKGFMEVTSVDIAGMFLSPETSLSYTPGNIINSLNAKMSIIYAYILFNIIPLFSFFFYPKETKSLFLNIRVPQTIYHAGLVYVGAGIALLFSQNPINFLTFFNGLALVLLTLTAITAWLTSVVVNDIFDESIDAITNTHRPLIQKTISKNSYKKVGWTLFFLSLFLAGIAHPYAIALVFVYHALTWLYNAPPFRLKRIPFIATFLGSIASFIIILLGYIAFDTTGIITDIPWEIIFLLLFSYTISLPIKDFKDIKGDKKNNIWTLPVLMGEKYARLFVATGIFFSFILSALILNAKNIIPWALIFSTIAFFIVSNPNLSILNKKITPQMLPGFIIGLVFLYTLILLFSIL